MRYLLTLLTAAAVFLGLAQAQRSATSLTATYQPAAKRLIAAALADTQGLARLEHLTTRIGNRLAGTASLDQALQWVAAEMRRDGLSNVTLQPVMVPHWVRGRESASIVAPVARPLSIAGLGNTIGTPTYGIEAEVIVAHSLDDLDQLGQAAEGKIILLNQPWFAADRKDERDRYAATSPSRSRGPSRAARLGAKAFLIRSLTGRSLYTPHTGAMNYDAAAPRIPAAAITVEDADWIEHRIAAGDPVKVHLILDGHHFEADSPSANVMGELRGREKPDEIIVLGGHIDSWDVGQGAHDDGAGVVASWQALALIKQLGLTPRRTIRAVGWTNEENGTRGARAYRDALNGNTATHIAAIEMDMGAETPLGFDLFFSAAQAKTPAATRAYRRMQAIGALLRPIGAGNIYREGGETDIDPLVESGVPGLGLHTTREHYFDWHHTHADTFDKIDPTDFRKNIASLAVTAYVLADMPEALGK